MSDTPTAPTLAAMAAMLLAAEFEDSVEVEIIKARRRGLNAPDGPTFEDDFFGRTRK
jgi:hypothetical protein